ncbi:MAG: protoglobin family protein [Pirellulaceae bacterium]
MQIKHVDESQLESDLEARYAYLAEFMNFTAEDVKAIHATVAKLAPLVPGIVERTYERLLSYDATARHFLPRQHGYDGPVPQSLQSLTERNEQIQFRKEHLTRYLMSLMGRAYDAKMVAYLDMVGKMHTPKAGNKEIVVPLVQMNALLGLMSDVLIETLAEIGLPPDEFLLTLRAFNKLLWIQNDLINRHYQAEERPAASNA